jgi:hypothetical protein
MHSNTTASQGPAGMAAVADNVHINPDSVLHRTFRSGGRKIKKNRPRLGMAQRETSRDRLAITPGVKFSTFNESDGHDLVGGSAWAAALPRPRLLPRQIGQRGRGDRRDRHGHSKDAHVLRAQEVGRFRWHLRDGGAGDSRGSSGFLGYPSSLLLRTMRSCRSLSYYCAAFDLVPGRQKHKPARREEYVRQQCE